MKIYRYLIAIPLLLLANAAFADSVSVTLSASRGLATQYA
jgi:hypothetical protein